MHSPNDFLLLDDGYYKIGKDFFYGESSLLHQYRTPGIPVLLSVLNFFPVYLHPFIRLLITQIFTLIDIFLAYKIFNNIIPRKAIFWGLVIALFNPLFLWWACLRSSPEIYITTFLGLIIYLSMKLKKWNTKLVILLVVSISISFLFKPVLVLIPLTISCAYFFYRRYKLAFMYLLVFVICLISFKIVNDISKREGDFPYGVIAFMVDPCLTQSIMESGKLGYYSGESPLPEPALSKNPIKLKVAGFLDNYVEKNHNYNSFKICFKFFKENTGIVILSKILSPIYFISIADTSSRTISNLIINLILIILAVRNMKIIRRDYPEQILLIIYIFFGYYLVYFLIQSCARYFIPISFYMCVFIGISITTLLKKYNLIETK